MGKVGDARSREEPGSAGIPLRYRKGRSSSYLKEVAVASRIERERG